MIKENTNFNTLNLSNIAIISSSIEDVNYRLTNLIQKTRKQNLIITFNLDFYRNTEIYSEFRTICESADFIFPDGVGITKLLKLKHRINVKRITGNDLFTILLEKADKFHLNLALVGSTAETLEKLCDKIHLNYPGTNICAALSPPVNFEKHPNHNIKIIEELKESKPDILFLALGSPRQELWLQKNKEKIGAKVNMGVGAVFDFYSGNKRRSPVFFQKLGFEWFWRLITEPRRLFRRYLIQDMPFFIKQVMILYLNNNK